MTESTGGYYVSVVDAGRVGLLLGPFTEYAAALARVDACRELAVARDPWAHFYGFGTVRAPGCTRAGLFNKELGCQL